ncbi:IS30 family transposase [Photobacterium carnosum]|uniref:IS30 family transposase n=1 Tax=Photobacterium carnosum TaxID=2023717 RepID=UPI001E5C3CE3|nr:IS30 family transposase [Photobacterium carnosum]
MLSGIFNFVHKTNKISLSERQDIAEHRQRMGDWEGDTVFGQDAYLVTLVDRKSRLTLIGKVSNKTATTVANEMISLLKRVDTVNGGEFAHHKAVAKVANTDIYFAKLYASYQRGTNENMNDIIRRSWPKKMKLSKLSNEDIQNMELRLNTMPRKVLGGLTAIEVYTGKRVALIT